MPLGPKAFYADPNSDDPEVRAGKDMPRCKAKPPKGDTSNAARGVDVTQGRWECALPKGHEKFDNPRHHSHSWAQVN